MTDWRRANDLPGAADGELLALRAEVERLMELFRQAEAHPASGWWYVAQALGRDPLPRASVVRQSHRSEVPQHQPIATQMLDRHQDSAGR
jgi:hypothetical protein